MPRYIDVDELLNNLPDDLPYKASVKRVLIQAPTADVVPKSEVEQIKWERDVAIKQLEEIGLSFGEKTDGYGNLAEYAKQIFEKIEKALNNSVETEHFKGTWFNMSKFRQRIAKLKKKYTESEG